MPKSEKPRHPQRNRQPNAVTPPPKSFETRLTDTSEGIFNLQPRTRWFWYSIVMLAEGVVIGAIAGAMVSELTGQLPSHWLYISNILLALILRIAATWLSHLAVIPLANWVTKRFITRRYGQSVETPLDSDAGTDASTECILSSAIVSTSIATLLVLTRTDGAQWFNSDLSTIGIAAGCGAIGALAGALSNKYVIIGIARNLDPVPTNRRRRNERDAG